MFQVDRPRAVPVQVAVLRPWASANLQENKNLLSVYMGQCAPLLLSGPALGGCDLGPCACARAASPAKRPSGTVVVMWWSRGGTVVQMGLPGNPSNVGSGKTRWASVGGCCSGLLPCYLGPGPNMTTEATGQISHCQPPPTKALETASVSKKSISWEQNLGALHPPV